MGLPCGTFHQNYGQDMAIFRTKLHWLLLIAFFILLFAFPLYASSQWLNLAIMIGIAVITVLGLQILTGYCGQISLGQAAFMAVGAYTSAILCTKLGWSFWAALPLAGLFGGLVGIIFGLPSLKVKGYYLIMTTLAAQFIIIWFIVQLRGLTGGADGISVPAPRIGSIILSSKESYYYLVMIIAALATFSAENLARSKMGRAWVAIRDNDLAAEVMGVNLYYYKLMAFFVGCVYAGIAGSLLVHYLRWVTPEVFPLMDSIWYLGMLIVGGVGSISGAIFGVVFLKLLEQLVVFISPHIGSAFPSIAGQIVASLALIMQGLVIILFLIFEPRGVKHRWEIIKAYYRLWPFSY